MNYPIETKSVMALLRRIASVVVMVVLSISAIGQEQQDNKFYFEDRVAFVISSAREASARPHFLGEETGRKYGVFNDLYSYTVAGDHVRTGQQMMIDKPAIYHAVKRVNRYYRGQLRKKVLTEQETFDKVNHVLNVAISVYTQSTDALEAELRAAKKPEAAAKVFERVILQ